MLKILSFLNIILLVIFELMIAYKYCKDYCNDGFYLLLIGALLNLGLGVLIWVL